MEETPNHSKTPSVLVVEDDEFLRELIVTKLKQEKLTILEGINGKDGLQKMREMQPDLVLLDLILPGMDGFEVLRAAQSDPTISKIPVVVLSNLGQKEDIDRAKECGAKGYLVKAQFTPSEIVQKVHAFLGGNFS